MESDVDLLNAWRAGDAANGRLLFQKYFQALYRFFANKCDDPDEMVQRVESLERQLVSPLERAARERAFGSGAKGGAEELL